MQIQDKKSIKAKSFTMKAIMRNPQLITVLDDAINSPIGSTKRKRAKAILKSLKTAGGNYFRTEQLDGQGGVNQFYGMEPKPAPQPVKPTGMMQPGMRQPQAAPQQTDVLPVEAQAPRTRIFINSVDHLLARKKKTNDGQGGGGDTSGWFVSPTIKNAYNTVKEGVSNFLFPDDSAGKVISVTSNTPPAQSSSVYNIDTNQFQTVNKPTGSTGSATLSSPDGKYKTVVSVNSPESRALFGKGWSLGDSGASVIDAQTALTGGATSTGEVQGPTLESGQFYSKDELDNAYETGGISSIDSWYKSLDKSGQDMYADLYQAYNDGTGSSAWTQKALTNKNILSKVLGVPKEALDMFPDTGLVSEQLVKLKSEKKKEFNLTAWEDKMNKMLNAGASIKEDLTAYIRGKDEYLGSIDKMLDEASTKFAYMDTSNPYAKQRTGMYLNYLTILKGRQNQRYVNFLNTAVNYFNADMTATQNAYNSAYTKFKEAYTDEATMTTELFNNTKTLLGEMYTNLEKLEEKASDKLELQIKQQQAAYDMALDAVNLQIKQVELENKQNGVTDPDKYNSNTLNDAMGITTDKDGKTTMNVFDANDALLMAQQAGQTEANAYNRFIQASQSYLNSQLKGSGDTSLIEQFASNFEGYQDLLDGNYGDLDETTAANAIDATTVLLDKLQAGANSGIKSYLSDMEETISDLIDDINDGDDESEVVDNYKDSVNQNMINSIYQMIKASGQKYSGNASTLANDLAQYLTSNLY